MTPKAPVGECDPCPLIAPLILVLPSFDKKQREGADYLVHETIKDLCCFLLYPLLSRNIRYHHMSLAKLPSHLIRFKRT